MPSRRGRSSISSSSNALTDIVLVGHSYGGTIISKVAEAIPEQLRRLVFCSAFVLNDGESMLEAFPASHREMLTQLAAESTDNTVTLPFELWRETFINDADLETGPLGLRPAVTRTVSTASRAAGPQEVLHINHTEKLSGVHRGHSDAARRVGVASPNVHSPRGVPPCRNAGKSRSHLLEPDGPGRQAY